VLAESIPLLNGEHPTTLWDRRFRRQPRAGPRSRRLLTGNRGRAAANLVASTSRCSNRLSPRAANRRFAPVRRGGGPRAAPAATAT
jgi:hypothetical protein